MLHGRTDTYQEENTMSLSTFDLFCTAVPAIALIVVFVALVVVAKLGFPS